MSERTFKIGAHRGMGCTDHGFYQSLRDIASLPVENTLRSFDAAFDNGIDYLELDVQMSADGEIFLMHNVLPQDHFFGTEKPSGLLNTLKFSEYSRLKTGRNMNGEVARFSDALELIAKRDPKTLPWVVNVEIKGVQKSGQPYEQNNFIERLVAVVKASPLPPERILWSSFAFENVLRMSHLMPESHFGMLFCERGEINKTYTDHVNELLFSFLEFEEPIVEKIVDAWRTNSAVPHKSLYMHPEIKSMNNTMLNVMAAYGLSVNCWPFMENFNGECVEWYRSQIAYAAQKNVPLTVMTDYLSEFKSEL